VLLGPTPPGRDVTDDPDPARSGLIEEFHENAQDKYPALPDEFIGYDPIIGLTRGSETVHRYMNNDKLPCPAKTTGHIREGATTKEDVAKAGPERQPVL
jgi:hypothetical protein